MALEINNCMIPEKEMGNNENEKTSTTKRKALECDSSVVESSKRIHVNEQENPKKKTAKYQHGNYDRYYGYRNSMDLVDVRLEVFKMKKELFADKDILDIGCNDGFISIAIAKDFNVKSMTGIDIDKLLIGKANKNLRYHMKKISDPYNSEIVFPKNVKFRSADYVLRDKALLSLEQPQFDVITCLSVTKWIHLNSGDEGLKLAFKRMFKQLRPGGKLILEAQNWKSYKRRRTLTESIAINFENIKFYPNKFSQYLLGPDVGFDEVYELFVPEHVSKGFRRPIHVFTKNAIETHIATNSPEPKTDNEAIKSTDIKITDAIEIKHQIETTNLIEISNSQEKLKEQLDISTISTELNAQKDLTLLI